MKVRALFLSDLHLGSRACQAERILECLAQYEAETIYLIGDIIDGWRLRARWYWPDTHRAVLQRLVERAMRGVQVIYLPGNHDDFVDRSTALDGSGFRICRRYVHTGADGECYLVLHGDQFDLVEQRARWLSRSAARIYNALVLFNAYANHIRGRVGLPYSPYASWIKQRFKSVVCFISSFEANLRIEAERHGCRGVICGHIHHPALYQDGSFCYMNTGDWVESCTAIAEHQDGRFELICWTKPLAARAPRRSRSRVRWLMRPLAVTLSMGMLCVAFCVRLTFATLRRAFASL